MDCLLSICDLRVDYVVGDRRVPALREVTFQLSAGEAVGILGESGCGKSTLARAIMGLLPGAAVVSGSIRLRGDELLGLSDHALQPVRGVEISIVDQEPALALNPVLRIGQQVMDVLRAHPARIRHTAEADARAILDATGLGGDEFFRAFPHQLSGGQRQRVGIAQAVACRPALLIADEPTSSLDAVTQTEILPLLRRLREQMKLAVLLISHDPSVLGAVCDRVLVMYAGRVVEQGTLSEIYHDPFHPYTRGLVSLMRMTSDRERRLPGLKGSPADMANLPAGCAFEPRCPEREDACALREPGEFKVYGRVVRCVRYE
jgi:oligopeptide/dipeptide ABC transporter ATP-binding protein